MKLNPAFYGFSDIASRSHLILHEMKINSHLKCLFVFETTLDLFL